MAEELVSFENQIRQAERAVEADKALLVGRLRELLKDDAATFRNMDGEARKQLLSLARAFAPSRA